MPAYYSGQNFPRIGKNPLVLWDISPFYEIVENRGRKRLVGQEAFLAYQERLKRKAKTPTPPRIQILLKQAYELHDRLKQDPNLTQLALAAELKVHPSRITQIMNLLKLAPEIQHHVLTMPPSIQRCRITEHRLRLVVLKPDHKDQLKEYGQLVAQTSHHPSP